MRYISKNSMKPKSLVENDQKWTQELLAAVAAAGSYTKTPDTYKNRYKQEDVLNELRSLFSGKCCYCESSIGVTEYEHIEHRQPKAVFNDQSFEWSNLHLACQVCNVSKGDKWDTANEILDARKDQIDQHLEFRSYLLYGKSPRGETTIEHVKLNRKPLLDARLKVLGAALELIASIQKDPSPANQQLFKTKLQQMYSEDSEFYCLVQTLVNDYL